MEQIKTDNNALSFVASNMIEIAKREMKSIFIVDEVSSFDSEEHDYQEASHYTLGYYTDLETALNIIRPNNLTDDYEESHVYAYLIKEVGLNGRGFGEDWVSVRTYSPAGELIDQCLHDYNQINSFEGRDVNAIRFQEGDIVEALLGDIIITGIVAALPPTPETKKFELDAMDDAYLVLSNYEGQDAHYHVPPTHVFPITYEVEEKKKEHLHAQLDNYKKTFIHCG